MALGFIRPTDQFMPSVVARAMSLDMASGDYMSLTSAWCPEAAKPKDITKA